MWLRRQESVIRRLNPRNTYRRHQPPKFADQTRVGFALAGKDAAAVRALAAKKGVCVADIYRHGAQLALQEAARRNGGPPHGAT